MRTLAASCFIPLFLHAAFPAWAASPAWNVLLVSIDTLRADRIGAYGYAKASTPNIDRAAREGVLFERVFTPVPLTLPAHTSLFTSMVPPSHGVRDNGQALVETIPTLAEQFRGHGYQTGAFVAAFVLDRRFGLARGFDTYWGEFPLHRFAGADPGEVQLRGDQVEAAASHWIDEHSASPFFAFVHFYDLHGPYLLPPAWRARFPGRLYDGELSYVDSMIGRLWQHLEQRGVANRTLLAITADHGEGLGEHGERNHGFFVYRSTTEVPFILRYPRAEHAGLKVHEILRLIDIAPTLCALAGVPARASFQGRSAEPLIAGKPLPAVPAYSESLYPFRHFHSSPLYAYRDSVNDYIQSPRPELYSIDDAHEVRDQAGWNKHLANSVADRLVKLLAIFPTTRQLPAVSADVQQKLRSLGYVSGGSSSRNAVYPPTVGVDPKDRIALYTRFQDALGLENSGKVAGAAVELEKIAEGDRGLVSVWIEAGVARQRLGDHPKAIADFKAALAADPENALAHYDVAISLSRTGRDTDAVQELNLAIGLEPWMSRAYTARGLAEARLNRQKEAIASFDRALGIDPGDFDAWLNRGSVRGASGDLRNARTDLEKAIAIEPNSAEAHQALGTLAFYTGDLERASQEYLLAVKLEPQSSSIHSDLGLLYAKLGKKSDAVAEFRKALTIDPHNNDAATGLRAAAQ